MAWVEFNNDVYSRNKVRVSKVIIAIVCCRSSSKKLDK